MKKSKNPKSRYFSQKQIRDLCDQCVSKTCILMITAVVDELDIEDDDIVCKIAERTQRYAVYEKDHLIRMDEVSNMLKKKTGIEWRW